MGIRERKEREKEERREQIIDAAEKVFFEKGLSVATMDEIAERAELSKGTLYLYYKSKEDIYLAAALRGTEIMYDLFKKALANDEPTLMQIFRLGEAYIRYFKEHRDYFRMSYFFEAEGMHSQVSDEMMSLCADEDRKVWTLVFGLLKRAVDEGLIHNWIDPVEASVILWSNSNGFMRLMDRTDTYWTETMGIDLEATLRRANEFILEGMMTEKAKKLYGTLLAKQKPAPAAARRTGKS